MDLFKVTSSSGFTLVEMLVTIAIMGVLVGMAAPQLASSIDQWRAERFARSVWQSVRTARLKAKATNRAVQVKVNLGTGDGSVQFFINDNPGFSAGDGGWNESSLQTLTTPEKVNLHSVGSVTSGSGCFWYDSAGGLSEAYPASQGSMSCSGSGSGDPNIHVSRIGVTANDANACDWRTIYLEPTRFAVPRPVFINYGAYEEFSHSMGDDPC